MRGDGSIFLTKNNGKLRYAYRWRQDGKSHTKFFPATDEGKRSAIAFKKDMRTELQKGIRGSSASLYDSIIAYLRNHKLDKIRQSSYNRCIDTLFAIPDWLRNKRIDQITKDNIQQALNETGLSASSKRKIFDIINATYKNLVDNKILRDNPCVMLTRPKMEKVPKSIFTNSEIFRLFRTIRFIQKSGTYHSIRHDYYALFSLMLHGLRIGEVLALRWEDFSWNEGEEQVHVQRTLDTHYIPRDKSAIGLQQFNPPKTASGDRWVPLFSKKLVQRLKSMQPTENATGQVFATKSGNALSYPAFHKTWAAIGREYARRCPHCGCKRPNDWYCSNKHHITRRALFCRECGEERPKQWTCSECGTVVTELHKNPHCARHTFVTHLLNHNIGIKTVQALVGDADSSVVLDVYGHAPTNLRKAVKEQFRK